MYLEAIHDHYPNDRILDESENFYLTGANESVYLLSKKTQNPITQKYKVITCPGDHYGDVMAGFIDKKERYCVSVGCGYIVYFLHKPFREFIYKDFNKNGKSQWIEDWNHPERLRFFEDVRQIDDWEFEIMDADTGEWERIRIQHPEEVSK